MSPSSASDAKDANDGHIVESDGSDELAGLIEELQRHDGGDADDAERERIKNLNRIHTSNTSEEDPLDFEEENDIAGLVDELKGAGRGDTKRNRLASEDDLLADDEGEDLAGLLDQLKNIEGEDPPKRAEKSQGPPANLVFASEDDEDDDDWYEAEDADFDEGEIDDEDVEYPGEFDPNRTAGIAGDEPAVERRRPERRSGRADGSEGAGGAGKREVTFKEDFQGTRVFVQGLPEEATWKDLKDHFKIAGEVVFASVSVDRKTGRSKQCGIVQFETPREAQAAIRDMRNHPLNGAKLYVRKDVQESRQGGGRAGKTNEGWFEDDARRKKDRLPTVWRRANDEAEDGSGENWYNLRDDELKEIESLIEKRDHQRQQRNYNMSDRLRDQLKDEFGVHLDDRQKLWWTDTEHGGVPSMVSDLKGEGRWGKQKPWRQIPTSPESDSMVDSDLVSDLLLKRDRARQRKDFETADALLQKAHEAPGGGLGLRIHDESRTWRIWTERPPPRRHETPQGYERMTPEEMCLQIVEENEPEKLDEMKSLLGKFPGREYNIFKRLRDRYR
ncbi:hypothetical protein ACHAXT_000453 [Thalassiosira profunda]